MVAAGPAGPRRRLGAELRRLRNGVGMHLDEVAQVLGCSTSKVSRLETGKGVPKASDDRQRYLARLFLGRAAERRGRSEDAIRWYRRALETWPTSQAARFGLAHALEKSSGPGAAREIVGALLDPSRATDGPPDPWFLYPIGPPGLAQSAFNRVWDRTAVP